MTRLFRDWRFALLWVIGISTMASAFFAQDGGHEGLLPGPRPDRLAQPAYQSPSVAAKPQAQPFEGQPAQDGAPPFGEPVMDTAAFDPNPVEPGQASAAATATPAADGSAGAVQASEQAAPAR